jgi:hypothetical protein
MTTDENTKNYNLEDLQGWLCRGNKIIPQERYLHGWCRQHDLQYFGGHGSMNYWIDQETAARIAEKPAYLPGWETQEDLRAKTDYARKIVLEYAPGATTRKPKDTFNKFIDSIKRIQFPRSTLEQKIVARPKTVPRMVFSDIPGLPPRFVDMPVEESNSEAKGAKEGE